MPHQNQQPPTPFKDHAGQHVVYLPVGDSFKMGDSIANHLIRQLGPIESKFPFDGEGMAS